jgi:hypothetical protein
MFRREVQPDVLAKKLEGPKAIVGPRHLDLDIEPADIVVLALVPAHTVVL